MHALRSRPRDPSNNMWKTVDVLLSIVPEGVPDDTEKQKRFVDVGFHNHKLRVIGTRT